MARGSRFIGFDVNMFFDRPAVIAAIGKKKARVLAQTGGFGRRVIRNSMRKTSRSIGSVTRDHKGRYRSGGTISAPGEPPIAHTGQLRNLVLFQLNTQTDSVVIGAAKFNGKAAGPIPVPDLLEHGGTVTVRPFTRRGRKPRPPETWRYRPRPFIAPALEKTAGRMRSLMKSVQL